MPAISASIDVHELDASQWYRLLDFEPFASGGIPSPPHWRIVVAEDGGEIIAFTCLYTAVHYEPIWIDARHRHRPGLFAELWRQSKAICEECGVKLIFSVVSDTLPQQQELVQRFGFHRAPGQLFLGDVEKIGV